MFSDLLQVFKGIIVLALHIVNSGSFPKALTSEEEAECLKGMADGDEKSRQKLIEHNLRLVAHIAKKYNNGQTDPDDLISIGTIGLIKAVSTFKSDKGIRLATYAARCIENEILMYFRTLKKSSSDVFIDDPIDTDKDGNTLTLLDIISDGGDLEEELDTKINLKKLEKYIDSELDEREKSIIMYRYGLRGHKELPQREVAKKLGISRSYVSRIEKKVLLTLRSCLETGHS